jgi:signal transduction histidine kinase
MKLRLKIALSKIGPYPYNPYLVFLLFFSLQFSRFTSLIVEEPRGLERYKAFFFILLLSVPPALFFAVLAYIFRKYRFWSRKSLVFYILEVAFAQSFQFLYYPVLRPTLLRQFNYDLPPALTVSPPMFIVSLILALIGLYVMHRAERSITQRLDEANGLVQQLKVDRQVLINLDEEIRSQSARFLHDRFQSDLVLAAMKLKSVSTSSSEEVNEVITKVISRLEESRSQDLKNLIQTLSPNFESSGLEGALEALIQQHESDLKISLQIDEASENLSAQQLLGVYRIIEQALLNTIVHGPAKQVEIAISVSSAGKVEVSVSDDGPGAEIGELKPGVGSAIIDSWVGILNAEKIIDTVPGRGYRIQISFRRM